jgi:hypothetical protein
MLTLIESLRPFIPKSKVYLLLLCHTDWSVIHSLKFRYNVTIEKRKRSGMEVSNTLTNHSACYVLAYLLLNTLPQTSPFHKSYCNVGLASEQQLA